MIQQNNLEYYDRLGELNKKLLFFISFSKHSPTLNIEDMLNILPENEEESKKEESSES